MSDNYENLNRPPIKLLLDGSVPDDMLADVESRVRRLSPILPHWLNKLLVFWSETKQSLTASVSVNTTYRWAHVYIHPGYLEMNHRERDECILHEFVHISLDRMCAEAAATVDDLVEDQRYRDRLRNQMRDSIEECVQDTALGVYRLLDNIWRQEKEKQSHGENTRPGPRPVDDE